jgi:hypothetical protein
MNICKLKKAVAYTLAGLFIIGILALFAIRGWQVAGISGAIAAIASAVIFPAIGIWVLETINGGCK